MSGLSRSSRQWIGLALLLTTGGGWLVWWAVCAAVPTTVPPPPLGGFAQFLMVTLGVLAGLAALALVAAMMV